MRIKNVLILSALIFTCCILGCSEDTNGPSSNGVIMPLAVGNEWVYKVTRYNIGGMVDTVYIDTLSIIGTKLHNGRTVYVFNTDVLGENRDNGYWNGLPFFDTLSLLAKYPCTIGETFRRDTLYTVDYDSIGHKSYDTTTIDFSCKETSLPVSVSAGSFISYFYQISTNSLVHPYKNRIDLLYSPNIGEVLSYNYAWNDTLYLYYKRELMSYHLN